MFEPAKAMLMRRRPGLRKTRCNDAADSRSDSPSLLTPASRSAISQPRVSARRHHSGRQDSTKALARSGLEVKVERAEPDEDV